MHASTSILDVFNRDREIAAFERNPEVTRRPTLTMLAGLLLAAVSAVLCALLAYDIWYEKSVPVDSGLFGISLLFCFYVGGAYVFALAYELYDVGRALRLTIVLALIGVLALAFMIGVLLLLGLIKSKGSFALSDRQADQARGVLGLFDDLAEDDSSAQTRPTGTLLITCQHCGKQFIPLPPNAICPWCNTAYLTT